jgi:hypothetical protein
MDMFMDPSISNLFTTSIEIELESTKLGESTSEYTNNQVLSIMKLIKNSLLKELGRSDWFDLDKNSKFIDDILNEIENDYDDDEYILDEVLSEKTYRRNRERLFVVQVVKPLVINYFFKDNFVYLIKKFKDEFPFFYKKWSKHLKFEIDNTLDRGIELSNSTYFIGVDNLIDLINDFYDEYETNKKWKFQDSTGIHINIGSIKKEIFNPIKGILFLDDEGSDPFVFKNMTWRHNNKYCGSLRDELKKDKDLISKSFECLKSGNISDCEELLNNKLQSILIDNGYKNFGLNLLNFNKNYVEFRYPGGDIEKDVLIDKILYFMYVYYMMVNPNLDKKEYHKKLYKFLSN